VKYQAIFIGFLLSCSCMSQNGSGGETQEKKRNVSKGTATDSPVLKTPDGNSVDSSVIKVEDEAAPSVSIESISVWASFSENAIRRTVTQNYSSLLACYSEALKKNSATVDFVTIRFLVSGGGEITTAWITRSTINSKQLEKCITNEIQKWRMDIPREGGKAQIRFRFQAGSGAFLGKKSY